MSIKVLKAGISDSMQDNGRYGFAAFGINVAGVMDQLAMRTANALVNNPLDAPVLEMYFPAPSLLFQQDALISCSGADFRITLQTNNNKAITADINKTIWIKAGTTVHFNHKDAGECCNLAVHGGYDLQKWMGSYSTQFSIEKGGFKGRRLKRNDSIKLNKKLPEKFDANKVFPWRAGVYTWYQDPGTLNILTGPEWDWVEPLSQKHFLSTGFKPSAQSDRMGCRLEGLPLSKANENEMISSGTGFGTIQLLPNGQMIVLMADHPTTGGYPRIAQVISAHLPKLAQTGAGTELRFGNTDLQTAESLWLLQQKELEQLQSAVMLQLRGLLAEK